LQGDQSGNAVRTVAPDGLGDRLLFDRPPDCPAIGRPAWNPSDAQQLAISCTSAAGKTDLRRVTLQGVLVRRIQTKLAKVDDLSFSPDGRLLTYWGSQGLKAGGGQLYTQATDGTAAPKALTGAEFDDADPDFSPNGWNRDRISAVCQERSQGIPADRRDRRRWRSSSNPDRRRFDCWQ